MGTATAAAAAATRCWWHGRASTASCACSGSFIPSALLCIHINRRPIVRLTCVYGGCGSHSSGTQHDVDMSKSRGTPRALLLFAQTQQIEIELPQRPDVNERTNRAAARRPLSGAAGVGRACTPAGTLSRAQHAAADKREGASTCTAWFQNQHWMLKQQHVDRRSARSPTSPRWVGGRAPLPIAATPPLSLHGLPPALRVSTPSTALVYAHQEQRGETLACVQGVFGARSPSIPRQKTPWWCKHRSRLLPSDPTPL